MAHWHDDLRHTCYNERGRRMCPVPCVLFEKNRAHGIGWDVTWYATFLVGECLSWEGKARFHDVGRYDMTRCALHVADALFGWIG